MHLSEIKVGQKLIWFKTLNHGRGSSVKYFVEVVKVNKKTVAIKVEKAAGIGSTRRVDLVFVKPENLERVR